MRAAKCNPQREVQRGLPLALLGNFQRCLQCGSENSLISYGIFSVNTLRRAVCLPVCLSAMAVPAACLPVTPPYFFPFGRWVAGRSFPFSKALLHGAVGYKVFPINTLAAKREEDLSGNGAAPDLLADIKPRACFAFVNGNDCSAFL